MRRRVSAIVALVVCALVATGPASAQDPTATTGALYISGFTVASTSTVKYRAFDNAGNAEAFE